MKKKSLNFYCKLRFDFLGILRSITVKKVSLKLELSGNGTAKSLVMTNETVNGLWKPESAFFIFYFITENKFQIIPICG